MFSNGELVDESWEPVNIDGQVVAFWGTEIGARRGNAMVAWDYDGDLAVFKTSDTDVTAVWGKVRELFQGVGYVALEHTSLWPTTTTRSNNCTTRRALSTRVWAGASCCDALLSRQPVAPHPSARQDPIALTSKCTP